MFALALLFTLRPLFVFTLKDLLAAERAVHTAWFHGVAFSGLVKTPPVLTDFLGHNRHLK